MKKTKHLFLVLLLLVTNLAFAKSGDADFHLRIKNQVFTRVIDQVKAHFVEKDGYLKKSIPSQNIDLKIDLSNHTDIEDAHYYANSLMGINLKGENDIKFFIEKPFFQGKLNIGAPKFFSLNNAGSKLKVTFDVSLENYYLYFKHIWFAEKGFTQTSNTKENEDSCQKLIMEERYEGAELDVAKYKAEYEEFFGKVDKSEFYNSIKNNLFVRVDHFQLGWGNSHHGKNYGDDRNKMKIAIEAIVDLTPGAQTLTITKMDQNFGKKGGSWLPIHIPEKNIIIPPIMIRTVRNVVDENGYFAKDEQGNQKTAIRCTPIEMGSVKAMATGVVEEFSNKLPTYLNDDLIKNVVTGVNKQLASMKIAIPTKLQIQGDEFSDYEEKSMQAFGTVYVYKVPKKITGDIKSQVKKIIGDFYNYRAALGLYGVNTSPYGTELTMAFNGGLVIDNHEIAYRERDARVSYKDNFSFPRYNNENIAFAINRDMIQKIANIVRDRYLSTNIPEIVNVKINDNSIIIDDKGYLVFKPELLVKLKGYDIVSIPGLNVKAKIGFFTSSKDKRRKLNIELVIPNGTSIVSQVKTGKVIKYIDKAVDFILLNPVTWPLVFAKNNVLKPQVKSLIANVVDKYIADIKSNYTQFDVQDIVDQYGVKPMFFEFDSRGHASLFIDFQKVIGIDTTLNDLSKNLNNQIDNFKLNLDLKL